MLKGAFPMNREPLTPEQELEIIEELKKAVEMFEG